MKCPECGNEEHPKTAIFCVKCGACIDPSKIKPSEPIKFPCIFDLRCWLEGEKERTSIVGPYRRRFGICFTAMEAPRKPVAVDGTLTMRIKGILNKADLRQEVRIRKEDFAVRRFDLMTVSYASPCYVYRHPRSEIPVPTDGGCKIELSITADTGETFAIARETDFIDKEPGTGQPPKGPWTGPGTPLSS